jgi:hypothetical protein
MTSSSCDHRSASCHRAGPQQFIDELAFARPLKSVSYSSCSLHRCSFTPCSGCSCCGSAVPEAVTRNATSYVRPSCDSTNLRSTQAATHSQTQHKHSTKWLHAGTPPRTSDPLGIQPTCGAHKQPHTANTAEHSTNTAQNGYMLEHHLVRQTLL